jgi:hypothetical protein
MYDIVVIRIALVLYLALSLSVLRKEILPLYSKASMVLFNIIIFYILYQIDYLAALLFMIVMIIGISTASMAHLQLLVKSRPEPAPQTPQKQVVETPIDKLEQKEKQRFLLLDNGLVEGFEYAKHEGFSYLLSDR